MRFLLAALLWAAPALAADRLVAPVPLLPQAQSPLARRGWDIWTPAAMQLPTEASLQIVKTAQAYERPGNHLILWHKTSGWVYPHGEGPDPERLVERFALAVDGSIAHALPDEPLARQTVHLRYAQGIPSAGANIHVDGGYVTVTHALSGPGTILYPFNDDAPSELPAGNGVAIMTGLDRENLLGAPATVHAAPPGTMDDRLIILARYLRPGFTPGGPGRKEAAVSPAQRTRAVEDYLRALGRRVYDLGDEILNISTSLHKPK